jgi:membrane-associated HD superfamily phosphohydrolase
MKAKGLDINMDDSHPKFVEKTLDISTPGEEFQIPEKIENVLEDLNKEETLKPVEEVAKPVREEVIIPEEPKEEEKKLESALICEEEISNENKEIQNWKQKVIDDLQLNFKIFIEYLIGFVIGISMSLFGYKFMRYVNKKKRARKGLFIGCLVSFILILFVCVVYMTYTRDVLLSQRQWRKHHKTLKHLKVPGFSLYLRYSVSNVSHGIGSALSSLVPSFSYSGKRHHRNRMRTRHKIKALRHMRSRIHRHLRVLL